MDKGGEATSVFWDRAIMPFIRKYMKKECVANIRTPKYKKILCGCFVKMDRRPGCPDQPNALPPVENANAGIPGGEITLHERIVRETHEIAIAPDNTGSDLRAGNVSRIPNVSPNGGVRTRKGD